MLSEIERRALLIVKERNGQLRASAIGWELWKDTNEHPKRGEGSHGTNKFCRAAGKILNRLEKQGLLRSDTDGHGILWFLTRAGEAVPTTAQEQSGEGEK